MAIQARNLCETIAEAFLSGFTTGSVDGDREAFGHLVAAQGELAAITSTMGGEQW